MTSKRLLGIVLSLGVLSGCGTLPSLQSRTVSNALPVAEARDTELGRSLAPQIRANPGKAGIYTLADPHDAFASRIMLARNAQRTLDVQYYIWHGDMTGTMLLEALHQAADRGVRVRLLLDDNNTSGLDATLAALSMHPNIEVRLFNPFAVRSPRWVGYLTDFSRLNRRMHNKSFTADNQATIVGGRNIGDEYFGSTDGVLFADLDVLVVGPVVNDVSTDFDLYWASESAYPVELLLPQTSSEELQALADSSSNIEHDPQAKAYVQAIKRSALIQELRAGKLKLHWSRTRMVSDDPAKALGRIPDDKLIMHGIEEIVGDPKSEVLLVSPYFVPGEQGAKAFAAMRGRGVDIRVLTNSLDATDVSAVHAGYAKRRKPLLRAGVKLYELRRLSPDVGRHVSAGPFGSSGSSLHAKTFSVDRSHVFVGSFNFDPRSARLNTELGFIIDSPMLASEIGDAFRTSIPANSYEVRLDGDDLIWLENHDGKTLRHKTEPGTSIWKRAWVAFLSLLPIDWLL
ncbi:MAG TPA: phospholipase D family protein [Candidimonas sp.]|nr:phospholipase D family protein [Candidimonas sp.]